MMEESNDDHDAPVIVDKPTDDNTTTNITDQLVEAASDNAPKTSGPSTPGATVVTPMKPPAELPQFTTPVPLYTTPSHSTTTDVITGQSPVSVTPKIFTPTFPTTPTTPPVSTMGAPSYGSQTPPIQQIPHYVSPPPPMQYSRDGTNTSIDLTLDPATSAPTNAIPSSPKGGGLIGWFSGSGLMNKVKSSVETMITTLDPGMKEYINSGGDIDIIVTSDKDNKVCPVREAFQGVFGKATVHGVSSQATIAPQPVGFTAGLKGAEERIENLRQTGLIEHRHAFVSIENFLVELLPDSWFDIGCVLLKDTQLKIDIQVFTQATPIGNDIMAIMQDETPSDYNLRWSGYAVTLGDAIQRKMPYINRSEWHEAFTGVSRREMLLTAAKSLAGLYKQRLPQDVMEL